MVRAGAGWDGLSLLGFLSLRLLDLGMLVQAGVLKGDVKDVLLLARGPAAPDFAVWLGFLVSVARLVIQASLVKEDPIS